MYMFMGGFLFGCLVGIYLMYLGCKQVLTKWGDL
jgi:type VI protein secretion system component VasF